MFDSSAFVFFFVALLPAAWSLSHIFWVYAAIVLCVAVAGVLVWPSRPFTPQPRLVGVTSKVAPSTADSGSATPACGTGHGSAPVVTIAVLPSTGSQSGMDDVPVVQPKAPVSQPERAAQSVARGPRPPLHTLPFVQQALTFEYAQRYKLLGHASAPHVSDG